MRAELEAVPRGGDRLLNRELSWLEFNARVLDLASDPAVPLLERVKFCSIFSANLDEFFMVRVAGLMGQEAAGIAVRSIDGRTPTAALAEIRERVLGLTARQSRLWGRELVPALAEHGVADRPGRGVPGEGARRAREALRSRDLPGAHAARRRAGAALPVHLGPLEQPRRARARPGDRGGALRAREDPGGPAALPRGRESGARSSSSRR